MKNTLNGAVPEVAFDTNAATGVDVADTGQDEHHTREEDENSPQQEDFFHDTPP